MMMTFVFVVSRVLGNAYANGQYLDEEIYAQIRK